MQQIATLKLHGMTSQWHTPIALAAPSGMCPRQVDEAHLRDSGQPQRTKFTVVHQLRLATGGRFNRS